MLPEITALLIVTAIAAIASIITEFRAKQQQKEVKEEKKCNCEHCHCHKE